MSPFLAGFTWLLLFQCAGEALVRIADLPIPGPVLGIGLLPVALLGKRRATESMAVAADGLARHLSLLFVPAGTGVMLHVAQIEAEWVPIAVAIGVSTVLAIGKYVLNACRVGDWRARGFALGLAAHGIGTARAFQVNAEAGAFASLAFALHGLLAALLFPLAYLWFTR